MSSIPQNNSDEKALSDSVQKFFSKHHVGKLLAADIVNNNIRDLTNQERKMYSSLMTVLLIAPAVRKQNWDQKF